MTIIALRELRIGRPFLLQTLPLLLSHENPWRKEEIILHPNLLNMTIPKFSHMWPPPVTSDNLEVSKMPRKSSSGKNPNAGTKATNGFSVLSLLAERLPLGKLSTAQTTNVVLDIAGGVLCGAFFFKSHNDILKFICIIGVFIMFIFCVRSTDRRRRF